MNSVPIYDLVQHTGNELKKIGLSTATIEKYRYYGFNCILRVHAERGVTQYSPELAKQLYENTQETQSASSARTVVAKLQILRKAIALLEEYSDTGALKWRRLSPRNMRPLCDEYSKLLNRFSDEAIRTGMFVANSVSSARGAIHSIA